MRKLLVLLLLLVGALVSCESPSPDTTTTTTNGQNSTTTSTVPPSGDATAALQEALNAGDLFVNQTYSVEGTLNPPAGRRIEFGPNGKFVRSNSPLARKPIILLDKGNNTLVNVRIQGSNPCHWDVPSWWSNTAALGEKYAQYDPAREFAHGIDIQAGSNYTVTSPSIRDVWGDGINIDGRTTTDIEITNMFVRCVGRSVVSNTGSRNVTITGGEGSGAFYWIFNIEPYNINVVENYKVSGVKVGFSRLVWLFSGGPYFNCNRVINVDMRNNTLLPQATRPPSINQCVASQIKF